MYCIDSIYRNGKEVHFINVKNSNPNAPILFMNHGFPDNAFGWDLQIESLKEKYHIIAPFMHGTLNDEEVCPKRISIKELKSDIIAIIKATQVNENVDIYLVGHDLGCFLNTPMYYHYKRRIKGIVNINGLPLVQYFSRKLDITQWMKSYYIFIAQSSIARYLISKMLPKSFLNIIYNFSKLKKSDPIRGNDSRVFNSIYIYKILLVFILRFFFFKPKKIKAETVFIWGNDDVFLNIPTQDEVDKVHTNGVIRVIKGGHWVMRSNHTHVNRILDLTLSRWEKDHSKSNGISLMRLNYE